MKHRLLARIMGVALALMLTISMNAIPSLATTGANQQNAGKVDANQLLSTININQLSTKFHVDPNELRAAIEGEANSNVFSPFSAVKANYGVKASTSKVLAPNDESQIWEDNQNGTAYVSHGTKTASGLWPAVGMCAVHHYSNGTPYIPFGTTLYYPYQSVPIQGSDYNSFTVQDTGDPNFVQSAYWTDFYFGDSDVPANVTAAIDYGNQLVTYYFWGEIG